MKTLTNNDFILMPWKNGGGQTLELYKELDKTGEMNLRLSMATIDKPGPFSIFSGIERHLLILDGHSLSIQCSDRILVLKKHDPVFVFDGEGSIFGTPHGSVVDFNVMIRKDWGKASVEYLPFHLKSLNCVNDMILIFSPSERILRILTEGESIHIKSKDQICVKIERLFK